MAIFVIEMSKAPPNLLRTAINWPPLSQETEHIKREEQGFLNSLFILLQLMTKLAPRVNPIARQSMVA